MRKCGFTGTSDDDCQRASGWQGKSWREMGSRKVILVKIGGLVWERYSTIGQGVAGAGAAGGVYSAPGLACRKWFAHNNLRFANRTVGEMVASRGRSPHCLAGDRLARAKPTTLIPALKTPVFAQFGGRTTRTRASKALYMRAQVISTL